MSDWDQLILVDKVWGGYTTYFKSRLANQIIPESLGILLYLSPSGNMEKGWECGPCCISSIAASFPMEAHYITSESRRKEQRMF